RLASDKCNEGEVADQLLGYAHGPWLAHSSCVHRDKFYMDRGLPSQGCDAIVMKHDGGMRSGLCYEMCAASASQRQFRWRGETRGAKNIVSTATIVGSFTAALTMLTAPAVAGP